MIAKIEHLSFSDETFCTQSQMMVDNYIFRVQKQFTPPKKNISHFLALLDYVSRAHGMGLLSVVRRPSVRPSVSKLSLNRMHGFLSNYGCGFPWAMR